MQTKTHGNKLQKSSKLFLPLGLVLTLLTIYGLLEIKTPVGTDIPIAMHAENQDPYNFAQQKEIQIERPKTEVLHKEVKKKPEKQTHEFEVSDDPTTIESEFPIIINEEDPNPSSDSPTFYNDDEDDELEDDSHLIMDLVDEIPIFPGCEKGSRAEKKSCFQNKVRKFIGRKFNGELANTLGLSSGKKRIFVKFIITKTGEIKIDDSIGPHVRLEKEGERVVKLLPKMIPGMQNGRKVNVSYMLPITLVVE